ncbi:MAG: PEP-CTERM system histidine kinase PrsK [Gammaproteobacteria bacterium]|nr:PEP-CTERM system histidine kinase PrsK [Gammaproteobacteria bacterium]
MNSFVTVLGYSSAGIAFLALLVRLLADRHELLGGRQLILATSVTMIWASMLAFAAVSNQLSGFQVFLIEISHDTVWLIFLAALMSGALSSERIWLMRYGGVLLSIVVLLLGVWFELTGSRYINGSQLLVVGSLVTALYGLIGIEQIYRNARPSQKNGLKFLGLGIGGIFGFDLFLYSDAVISGGISPLLWSARGYVVTICVPLIAIAVQRIPASSRGIFFSRKVVFYSATLVGAGIYFTAVGGVGYLIRVYGKDWGTVAQLVFFSTSVLGLLIVLMSEQTRAKIRVFIAKHFFEEKYEYRKEWLRLTNTLISPESSLPLKKRAIKALAQIIGAKCGYLWLESDESSGYRCETSWNTKPKTGTLSADCAVIQFVRKTGWVLSLGDIVANPDRYDSLASEEIPGELFDSGIIVPLLHHSELSGFVELSPPPIKFEMNFEDHDLLKTAGQQVASFLTQELSTEQLAENRQFEAFNRLTTFIMHDLKNVMAQQSLVVENAEKHKRNPEFVDDVVETIKGSVKRMRRMLGHLQQGGVDQRAERIDLSRLLLEVVSQCSDRSPLARANLGEAEVRVFADRDRLFMAISHALRNAQDATDSDGVISLELSATDTVAVIMISDNGCGMDEVFVRERLFKPFDSTKGAQGMGIGAYQIRETIKGAGGHLTVVSVPGEGTELTITLPLAGAGSASNR